jgi:hypothetical protein
MPSESWRPLTAGSVTACASTVKSGPVRPAPPARLRSACAMVSGSWCTPLTRNSKCRCGPVAQPVAPTAPICWPCRRLALLDEDAAQVRIDGGVVVAVLHEHHLAKPALHAGELDHTVTDSAHRCAGGRRVVRPQMGAPGFQDRVEAHLEAAGHARELHRRRQEAAPQALAVERVVPPFAAGLLEPHRLVRLAVVDEFGATARARCAAARRLPPGFRRRWRSGRPCAARGEIDVAREDLGDLDRDRRPGCGIRRWPQTARTGSRR